MDREQLKNLIREVLEEREQQIKYPLDDTSRIIVTKDCIVFSDFQAGTTTNNGYIVTTINGQRYEINVKRIT